MKDLFKFKKYIIVFLSFAIVASSVAFVAAKAGKSVAVVLKVKGPAEISRGAKKSTAKRGTRMNSGDKIATKSKGFAAVMFTDDKSILKVKPNSILTIQGTRSGKSIAKQVTMDVGEMFVKVSKQKGTFQIATPTSVASVKGTQFWALEGDQGTTIITLEGVVELVNKTTGNKVDIPAGQTGISLKNGNVTAGATQGTPPGEPSELEESIEIEFEDPDGNKKTLKIKF